MAERRGATRDSFGKLVPRKQAKEGPLQIEGRNNSTGLNLRAVGEPEASCTPLCQTNVGNLQAKRERRARCLRRSVKRVRKCPQAAHRGAGTRARCEKMERGTSAMRIGGPTVERGRQSACPARLVGERLRQHITQRPRRPRFPMPRGGVDGTSEPVVFLRPLGALKRVRTMRCDSPLDLGAEAVPNQICFERITFSERTQRRRGHKNRAVPRQVKRAEDRGWNWRDLVAEWRGAEARMKLTRRAAPTDAFCTFEHGDAEPGAGKRCCRRQAVRARTDDRRVVSHRSSP